MVISKVHIVSDGYFQIAKITSESISENELGLCQYHWHIMSIVSTSCGFTISVSNHLLALLLLALYRRNHQTSLVHCRVVCQH